MESLPVAGIQRGAVALSLSFWLPIACSLPEYWSRSRYRLEALCPLQTRRPPFPVGHPACSVLPGDGLQCSVTACWCLFVCLPHGPAQFLDPSSALWHLEESALGQAERAGLHSESVLPQYRLFGIFTASFFSMTFSFKTAYKRIVC